MRTRLFPKALVGSVVLVVVATATGTTLSACGSRNSNSAGSSTSSSASPPTGTINPTAARQQVTLPIKGSQHFIPQDVAVDAQGAVYATAVNDGVLKLAEGAQAAASVGFTGLQFAVSGGADAAGNVYVTDDGGTTPGSTGRVQKRTPAGAQTQLPFAGLAQDPRLAVAPDGTVYVADFSNNRVLKLPPGATSPSELPFTGLKGPGCVAVDSAGNVYVSEVVYEHKSGNPRVLMLAAGSTAQSVLPITAQEQRAIAVDSSGTVYLTGSQGVTVMAKGSQQTTPLPVSGGRGGAPELLGIAVDTHGNIYLADRNNDQFIELNV
jgi:serine/threonine protein kinase, bacterial